MKSKHLILFLLAGVSSLKVYATDTLNRKNIIYSEPPKFFFHHIIGYQREVSDRISIGVWSGVQTNDKDNGNDSPFKSYRIDPYVKWKFNSVPNVYLQLKASIMSVYDSHLNYTLEANKYQNYTLWTQYYEHEQKFRPTGGAGFAIGYQSWEGKKSRLWYDVLLEFQVIPEPTLSRWSWYRENVYNDSDNLISSVTLEVDDKVGLIDWSIGSLGAFFAPRLRVGYSF